MHDSQTHAPDEQTTASPGRSRGQRVSIPAVIGVMLFVAGSIAFGILGPRMEQRAMLVPGHPLGDLVDEVIQDHILGWRKAMIRGLNAPMHKEEALSILMKQMGEVPSLPELEELGWVLQDAQEALGSSENSPDALRLIYLGPQVDRQQRMLMVHLVAEPETWVHFDSLGRQVPMTPLTRIDEAVDLGEGWTLGVSIVCFPSYAAIVTALDRRDASEAADLIVAPGGGNIDLEAPQEDMDLGTTMESVVLSGGTYSKRRFQRARMKWMSQCCPCLCPSVLEIT